MTFKANMRQNFVYNWTQVKKRIKAKLKANLQLKKRFSEAIGIAASPRIDFEQGTDTIIKLGENQTTQNRFQ
jgi:hypothetical protein